MIAATVPRTSIATTLDAIRHIQDATARAFGVTVADLRSPRQDGNIAKARRVAMWLCRHAAGVSNGAIARAFDKHHTTPISAIKQIERQRQCDPQLARKIQAITSVISDLPQVPQPSTGVWIYTFAGRFVCELPAQQSRLS